MPCLERLVSRLMQFLVMMMAERHGIAEVRRFHPDARIGSHSDVMSVHRGL